MKAYLLLVVFVASSTTFATEPNKNDPATGSPTDKTVFSVGGIAIGQLEERIIALEKALRAISPTALTKAAGANK